MRKVQARLTYANVTATLALFLALGGGAYAAIDLVGRNDIKSKHIAQNTVKGKDVAEAKLTGNAQKLIYNAGATDPAPLTKIAKVGPYTIKGQCLLGDESPTVSLWVNGPAGTADWMHGNTENDASATIPSGGLDIPANVDTQILSAHIDEPKFRRIAGTAMLKSGSKLVEVEYHAVADARVASKLCFLYGTATRAT